MKTSYFGLYKGNKGVCISRSVPKWAEYEVAEELMPPWSLVESFKNGYISEEQFEVEYREEVLSLLDPQEVYDKYKNKTLLCYEAFGFCHRHIIAKWLNEELGVNVEELSKEEYYGKYGKQRKH